MISCVTDRLIERTVMLVNMYVNTLIVLMDYIIIVFDITLIIFIIRVSLLIYTEKMSKLLIYIFKTSKTC